MAWVVPYVIMTAVSVAVSYVMASAMKQTIEGAKLGDIAAQTAKEGGVRLITWGIVRPIGGNVIACSDPKKVTTTSGGGKGGGGGGQTTESVYRTYAIGICEGPITGIRRVWRNNNLVYDARGNDWGVTNNPVFLQKAKFYLGDYDQLPDPSLEAIFGVGNVPAHRGTCYMVVDNEDLTSLGGALPQFIFETIKAEGSYVTSKPYAIENSDSFKSSNFGVISGEFKQTFFPVYYNEYLPESINSDFGVTSGIFRSNHTDYTIESESINSDFGVTSGIFRLERVDYTNGIPESLNSDFGIVSGIFRHGRVDYSNYVPENLTSSFGVTGGSFGTP